MIRKLTSTAAIALVAAGLGVAAISPASAQQTQPMPQQGDQMGQPQMPMMGDPRQMGHGRMMGNPRQNGFQGFRNNRGSQMHAALRHGGGLFDFVCADGGAERMEIAFVRLSYRLDLTPDQTTLFNDLKSAVLTGQTQYADSCAAAQPAAGQATAPGTADATATPSPVDQLQRAIDDQSTRLDLMKTLLPKLEAFYSSLTPQQQASLMPRQNGMRGMPGQGMPGQGMPGQGMHGHLGQPQPGMLMAPGAMPPPAPEAPATQPAPDPTPQG